MDLREVTGPKGWGCRKLYAHVRNLSRDAALWRAQEQEPGERIDDDTIRTSDPNQIRAFVGEHFGEPEPDSGGPPLQAG